MQSPGFQVFVYAIFTCQHRMFHVTAARQSLLLDSARGTINVATDSDWKIKTLQIDFEGKLNKLFYADKCLLEQPFVKEPKTKVKALVDEKSKALGDEIKVVRFARYELGAE